MELSIHSLDNLQANALSLFDTVRDQNFAFGREWFGNVVEHGLAPGCRAGFALLTRAGVTLAAVPLQWHRAHRIGSLTNCYTCLYAPLIAPDAPPEAARVLGRELGRFCLGYPLVRLDALPADWPALDAFVDGIVDSGLSVRRFRHFGNWHEPLAGRSWNEYLAARPGELRELLRRRRRQAARDRRIETEIVGQPNDLEGAILAFESVYRTSYKPAEPFPQFNAGLMRAAAQVGALRIAILRRAAQPIAAQFWIIDNGAATVMKLAHDMAHGALSPGTLLTAAMIEALIAEGVPAIDFGRGDDPYKRLWTTQRRQRIGLIFANPRRAQGIAALARHDVGRALRWAHRRIDPAGPAATPGL